MSTWVFAYASTWLESPSIAAQTSTVDSMARSTSFTLSLSRPEAVLDLVSDPGLHLDCRLLRSDKSHSEDLLAPLLELFPRVCWSELGVYIAWICSVVFSHTQRHPVQSRFPSVADRLLRWEGDSGSRAPHRARPGRQQCAR